MNDNERFMDLAIEEAQRSLRAGNSGFGAVLVRDGEVISSAHDTDKSTGDPTAHAELNVIRQAAPKTGGNFSDCLLVATREPCPMCATAIVWSGMTRLVYGYSIRESLKQGRKRIDLTCREVFERAGAPIKITSDVGKEKCARLYNRQVRKSIKQLRNADARKLEAMARAITEKRRRWFSKQGINRGPDDCLEAAYRLFCEKLGITQEEAPIVEKKMDRLVIHSQNFCPTLEACRILNLDTRRICRKLTEAPMDALLKCLHPGLKFERNYMKIRPYQAYCEEMIIWDGPG